MSDNKLLEDSRGFTIVELLIIISVTAILSVTFAGIMINYFILLTKNNAYIDMTASAQNLLRSTAESLRYGDGVRQTNAIYDVNAPSGGWNTANSIFVIVIAVPAEDNARNYIVDPLTNSPYMNELVYYKSGSTLMERTLANTSATGNSLKTSCPSNLASSSCPPDKTLADYVNSVTFTLYDQNNALTSDPTQGRSIQISLAMQRRVFGSNLTLNNSIRETLRNRF